MRGPKKISRDLPLEYFVNRPESAHFLKTALQWHGSITPRVMPRVLVSALYSCVVYGIGHYFPQFGLSITPFEYSGAVLALILVTRVNSGHDRWWEGRKLWGQISNQLKNMCITLSTAIPLEKKEEEYEEYLRLLVCLYLWPVNIKNSLRGEYPEAIGGEAKKEGTFSDYLLEEEILLKTKKAPLDYLACQISYHLSSLNKKGHLDSFSYSLLQQQRSTIVDAVGSCERIKSTAIPLLLAIKARRFLLLYVLLLPLAFLDRVGWITPFVVVLASYPLFSLEEIGVQLQNPFNSKNLGNFPLNDMCSLLQKSMREIFSFALAKKEDRTQFSFPRFGEEKTASIL